MSVFWIFVYCPRTNLKESLFDTFPETMTLREGSGERTASNADNAQERSEEDPPYSPPIDVAAGHLVGCGLDMSVLHTMSDRDNKRTYGCKAAPEGAPKDYKGIVESAQVLIQKLDGSTVVVEATIDPEKTGGWETVFSTDLVPSEIAKISLDVVFEGGESVKADDEKVDVVLPEVSFPFALDKNLIFVSPERYARNGKNFDDECKEIAKNSGLGKNFRSMSLEDLDIKQTYFEGELAGEEIKFKDKTANIRDILFDLNYTFESGAFDLWNTDNKTHHVWVKDLECGKIMIENELITNKSVSCSEGVAPIVCFRASISANLR